jgi:hypothetical protein
MTPVPAGCELAHLDAAYVLGALSPDERLTFERHLAGCPSCSGSVRDLAGLPGLLAQVPEDQVEHPGQPEPLPPTLLPSLVGEVRRAQRRRRWVVGLAAAAVLVVVGAGAAAVVATTGDDPAQQQVTQPVLAPAHEMDQLDQTAVSGDLALTPVDWGTRIDLSCDYDEPTSAYQDEVHTYALVVEGADGQEQQVATWKALPGRSMHLTGATALTPAQIASVEVRTEDGTPVLALTG